MTDLNPDESFIDTNKLIFGIGQVQKKSPVFLGASFVTGSHRSILRPLIRKKASPDNIHSIPYF